MEKAIDYSSELAKLNQFLKLNFQKIKNIVSFNPTFSKDDEWYHENEWDEYYEELKNN